MFCVWWRQEPTAAPRLHFLWIITPWISEHTTREEETHSQVNGVYVPGREEEEECNIPPPCEWGWGSPSATDKDLDRQSSAVRTGQSSFGPAQSKVSKVTMGCNMCVVQKPEEQYRVMFQVSSLSPFSLSFLFSFLSLGHLIQSFLNVSPWESPLLYNQ